MQYKSGLFISVVIDWCARNCFHSHATLYYLFTYRPTFPVTGVEYEAIYPDNDRSMFKPYCILL